MLLVPFPLNFQLVNMLQKLLNISMLSLLILISPSYIVTIKTLSLPRVLKCYITVFLKMYFINFYLFFFFL